jgi:non-ribosomal peptide synthetase component E (peptide arylation enzyme)
MILTNVHGRPAAFGGGVTLDELFRRAAALVPDAIALIDPPNRQDFTDGAPRRLTYAEADRGIEAIANRLRSIGLATDAIVGLQTANTVDGVLALLAVLRGTDRDADAAVVAAR